MLRFRLVPARLSEEDFWRCYFWHVANIKCELCHDWTGANQARREVVEAVASDEALLAADPDSPSTKGSGAGRAGPRDADLDAEFDRLVMSPD